MQFPHGFTARASAMLPAAPEIHAGPARQLIYKRIIVLIRADGGPGASAKIGR